MKDPYIQENGTLKNMLGITEYQELKEAEKDISYVKMMNIDKVFKGEFDIELFKNIHRHIFEDVYEWGGEFRTIPIFKEELIIPRVSLAYAETKDIPGRLEKNLSEMNTIEWEKLELDELVQKFTSYLSKIWRVHPFRDGNTRSTLAFANIFAKEHGFEMEMTTIIDDLGRIIDSETGKVRKWCIRDKFVLAALDDRDYPEPQALEAIIKQAIINGGRIKDNNRNELSER